MSTNTSEYIKEYMQKYRSSRKYIFNRINRRWRREHPYDTWRNMQTRCNDSNNKDYPRYGGRGITVCNEWSDYKVFEKWMLDNGWQMGLTIDRIDNDKGYYPENCQILTKEDNLRKRWNGNENGST